MKHIRPSADLRNNYKELSSLCKESGPVYITVNGRGDTVLVDHEEYELLQTRLELYELLAEGEADFRNGRSTPWEGTIESVLAEIEEMEKNGEIQNREEYTVSQ